MQTAGTQMDGKQESEIQHKQINNGYAKYILYIRQGHLLVLIEIQKHSPHMSSIVVST